MLGGNVGYTLPAWQPLGNWITLDSLYAGYHLVVTHRNVHLFRVGVRFSLGSYGELSPDQSQGATSGQ